MRQDTTISGFTGSKTKDNRYLSKLSLPTNSISSNAEERTELDSHADTCIAGQNYVVQHFTGVTCEVYPYDKSYEPQVVKIVDAITAYDDAASGETYILVLNQALHMPNQEPSLFCPNQLRHNGLIVNECPTQWADPIELVDLSWQVIILSYVVYNYERQLSLRHGDGIVHDYHALLCGF